MDVILTRSNMPPPAAATGSANAAMSAEPPSPSLPDDVLDRLIKLVPGQVIAGYTALIGVTAQVSDTSARWATPVALIACSLLVVLTLMWKGKSNTPPIKPPLTQYAMSMLAFWAWAWTVRDPLPVFGLTTPAWIGPFGCILIPIFGAFLTGVA